MTTTNTATRVAKAIRRRLTQPQLAAEARERFGAEPLDWRYRCPRCGHTQSAAELPTGRRLQVAQACFHCEFLAEHADESTVPLLWLVKLAGERRAVDCFPLADALDDTDAHSATLTAQHWTPGTDGPVRHDNAAAPVPTPVDAHQAADGDDPENEAC